ncbi:hypothetical protein HPB50_015059 [Hyalomma asiaticum]|uniref:Uncharacterized protein n=1 Tax=Hyalomma asiaticum TaxID=266040 RepID=A0ACB7TKB3_HYAAI|nr:hypothetical protein HPB50_015059 [Hyalomma asiaticum]
MRTAKLRDHWDNCNNEFDKLRLLCVTTSRTRGFVIDPAAFRPLKARPRQSESLESFDNVTARKFTPDRRLSLGGSWRWCSFQKHVNVAPLSSPPGSAGMGSGSGEPGVGSAPIVRRVSNARIHHVSVVVERLFI